MRSALLAASLALTALLLACASGSQTPGQQDPDGDPSQPVTYVVKPPAGKLPLPQHDPRFAQAEYDKMVKDIFIINNFPIWQGQDDGQGTPYIHDGIDFVLPNGTPIFALQDGVVVNIETRFPNYNWVLVQDADDPNRAWQYVHVDGFKVKVGDIVRQGRQLASISFKGVEHIHLNRWARQTGAAWRGNGSFLIWSEDRFDLKDSEPPTLEKGFHFWREGATTPLPEAPEPTLSGRVHIVAGVRDGGEQRRGNLGLPYLYGDRNAPKRVRLEIRPFGGAALLVRDCDFSKVWIPAVNTDGTSPEVAYRLFAAPANFPGAYEPNVYDKRMSFFVISRLPHTTGPTPLAKPGSDALWDTTTRLGDGSPQFPDGLYEVELQAWDGAGNGSKLVQRVRLSNGRGPSLVKDHSRP